VLDPTPSFTSSSFDRITDNSGAQSPRSKRPGKVAVKDGNGIAVSGATTFVTWNVPSGGTITQTATTNTKGQAAFTVTDLRGSYTLTVTNLTKTGYTLDPANSVLTKIIISKYEAGEGKRFGIRDFRLDFPTCNLLSTKKAYSTKEAEK
jgi:hypothetical protein